MAVAYSGTKTTGLGTAQSPTFNITVAGTNPVLLVGVSLNSATATVSSASFSLGSGTAVKVKEFRDGSAYSVVWAIPAPTGGAGTVTAGKSAASIDHQIDVSLWTGADQTTPCAAGDAATGSATTTSNNISALNVTANDVAYAISATLSNNPTGVTPNQLYLDSTTSVNMEDGYAVGSAQVTMAYDANLTLNGAMVAVRIAAAAAAGAVNRIRFPMGMDGLGGGVVGGNRIH